MTGGSSLSWRSTLSVSRGSSSLVYPENQLSSWWNSSRTELLYAPKATISAARHRTLGSRIIIAMTIRQDGRPSRGYVARPVCRSTYTYKWNRADNYTCHGPSMCLLSASIHRTRDRIGSRSNSRLKVLFLFQERTSFRSIAKQIGDSREPWRSLTWEETWSTSTTMLLRIHFELRSRRFRRSLFNMHHEVFDSFSRIVKIVSVSFCCSLTV